MGTLAQSKRQLAWVFDLNKCIGCQTCSVVCKVLWPGEDRGTESMWWMTVNTQPGRGMPRDWETMGGGYVDGQLKLGRRPTADEIGSCLLYLVVQDSIGILVAVSMDLHPLVGLLSASITLSGGHETGAHDATHQQPCSPLELLPEGRRDL